jgi:phospholipase/lecithinase/hemolysin
MSVLNLLKDLATGNFTSAKARVENWWSGVSPAFQALIVSVETNEGKILQGLVPIAAKDVLAGGLTTASFVTAIKDVGSQLLAQNITMANTTITAALNAEVGVQAAAAGVAVPTNAGPAVVAPVVVPVTP